MPHNIRELVDYIIELGEPEQTLKDFSVALGIASSISPENPMQPICEVIANAPITQPDDFMESYRELARRILSRPNGKKKANTLIHALESRENGKTMNAIQIFQNPKFGSVRTYIEPDGTVLFCGKDVAESLGYSNAKDAINRHCKGVVKRDSPTNSGIQSMSYIPLGDIYRLGARSQLPGAAEFESWIFDEVLPTLHRTGTYSIQKPMSPAELIAAQSQVLVELERKALQTENRVEEIEQKVERALEAFSKPNEDHWKEDMTNAVLKLCHTYKQSPVAFRGRIYKELEDTAKCRLESRRSRLKTRLKKQGYTYKEIEQISKMDVICLDPHLRAIFESIVRKYQATFCEQTA